MTADQYFKDHGISSESILKFGITSNKKKITIPIRDQNGEVLFNKYRHLEGGVKFSYDEGSHATLFNTEVLKSAKSVFIVEGEPDCIRLNQEGVAAITNTSGAGIFKKEWAHMLEDKKVFVLYDNDEAGQHGADKVIEVLPQALKVTLPEGNDICEYLSNHTIVDFRLEIKKQIDANSITYEELCRIIDKWLLLPDKNVIKILMAALIAHHFQTDPLWIFFVAPPSGSKTEIISTAATLPFVRMLSDLTAQTFASGMYAKNDPSLLLKLTNHVLVMKDFTTVLTMRREDRQVILSQLREIYDGKYSKAFGTGKIIEWEGRLTLLAGVTPIIDTHSAVFQVMGERFIMYRVPQSEDTLVAKKALNGYGNEKEMRRELANALKMYFLSLEIPDVREIVLPEEIIDALASLASLVVKSRSAIIRDGYKHEIEYIPQAEAPARLAKQLGTLVKALAVLDYRKVVNWNDYYLTLRVALDVIPANRSKHLVALCGNPTPTTSTTKVAQATDYSRSGSEIILEDLTALEIVRVIRGGSGVPNEWGLSAKTRKYFKSILPKDDEAIYEFFPEDSLYYPLIKEMLRDPKDLYTLPVSDEEAQEEWGQQDLL